MTNFLKLIVIKKYKLFLKKRGLLIYEKLSDLKQRTCHCKKKIPSIYIALFF